MVWGTTNFMPMGMPPFGGSAANVGLPGSQSFSTAIIHNGQPGIGGFGGIGAGGFGASGAQFNIGNPLGLPVAGNGNPFMPNIGFGGALGGGFNNFGDKIYNYIKMKFKDYDNLRDDIKKGGRFDVRGYGEVIAAGKGEQTPEVKAEIAAQYKMIAFPGAD